MDENDIFENDDLDLLPVQRQKVPVGCLKYHATGEEVKYYSEKELIEDYLEELQYLGYGGVSYELYLTPQEINELTMPNEEELARTSTPQQNNYLQNFFGNFERDFEQGTSSKNFETSLLNVLTNIELLLAKSSQTDYEGDADNE